MDNFAGQKFGKLTAEKYLGGSKWLCSCDCGNKADVFASNLKRGHTTSCGCARTTADLTGMRFDRLVAKHRVKSKKRGDITRAMWHCQCDCGNSIDAYSDSLQDGYVRSCGCIRKDNGMPDVIKKEFIDGTQLSKIKSKPSASNKSGVVGVNWDKSRGLWMAGIRFKGHRYNLGRYKEIEDAIAIRKMAEQKIFWDFLDWYGQQNMDNKKDSF